MTMKYDMDQFLISPLSEDNQLTLYRMNGKSGESIDLVRLHNCTVNSTNETVRGYIYGCATYLIGEW
jgi:hypothetical protein